MTEVNSQIQIAVQEEEEEEVGNEESNNLEESDLSKQTRIEDNNQNDSKKELVYN